MSGQNPSSWNEAVDKLRGAANELRSAAGRGDGGSAEEEAAAARLKSDVTTLEQSASDLREKLAGGIDAQRAEFKTALDRERAEETAGQLRDALEELAGLAMTVTHELKSAAETGLTQVQPEVRSAIRALEDVASSAGAWVRTIVDPERTKSGSRHGDAKPPLDDL